MRRVIAFFSLCIATFLSRSIEAQTGVLPQRANRAVALEIPSEVPKTLAAMHDYAAESKWNDAIAQLQQVSDRYGDALVAITPQRYVVVSTYCQIALCSWPDEPLRLYREKADPQARRWYRSAVNSGDDFLLHKILRHAFASSYGDDALWALAERAWEHNDLTTARTLWQQLLPIPPELRTAEMPLELIYPDSDIPHANIRARLILCSLLEGDQQRAQHELAAFRQLHPDAKGSLGGRTGELTAILEDTISSFDAAISQARRRDFNTFGGSTDRNAVLSEMVDVGAVRWKFKLNRDQFRSFRPRKALRDLGPLSFFPVVYNNLVLVNDADSIFAVNLKTGKAAWPIEGIDDASIFPEIEPERFLPIEPVVGVPFYTMTVSEGRLYARMGSPVTMKAKRELRSDNRLVCLDLEHGQGKLIWSVKCDALNPDAKNGVKVVDGNFRLVTPDWAFEGSPIVDGDRLFVAIKKSQRDRQTNVVCLNAETGQVIWNRQVCAALSNRDDAYNYMSHNLLTYAHGTVFYATGMGAVAALSGDDGVIQWVTTFSTSPAQSIFELSDQTKHSLTPCLYHKGQVFVATGDGNEFAAIDSFSGVVNWHRTMPQRILHLNGAADGRMFASGDSLWCFDTQTGRILWRHLVNNRADAGYGRGLVTRNSVLWPTRDEIVVFDQKTGQIQRRVALRNLHQETGGNLLIAGDSILIAQPDELVVFGVSAGMRRGEGRNQLNAQLQ